MDVDLAGHQRWQLVARFPHQSASPAKNRGPEGLLRLFVAWAGGVVPPVVLKNIQGAGLILRRHFRHPFRHGADPTGPFEGTSFTG